MKIQKTYEELFEISKVANNYLIRHKDCENKLCQRIRNLARTQIRKHFANLSDNDEMLRIDFCATDEKTKTVLKDEHGNYRFTREGIKSLHQATKQFRENTTVELDSRITEDVPDDLTQEEVECFAGLLIPVDYYKYTPEVN